eukprot:7120644-Prymnesium_polylepis.1
MATSPVDVTWGSHGGSHGFDDSRDGARVHPVDVVEHEDLRQAQRRRPIRGEAGGRERRARHQAAAGAGEEVRSQEG